MELEKVQCHHVRRDMYGIIFPQDSITKFDKFMIKQILYIEFILNEIV